MPSSGGELWRGLLARADLMEEVLARMSPASICALRLALLPGADSDSSVVRLLRPQQLQYDEEMSEQQLGRVVDVPPPPAARQGMEGAAQAQQAQAAMLERADRLTALRSAWLFLPDPAALDQLATSCASSLTRLCMSGVEWREPWFSRGPGAPQLDPLPAQLSLLTGLEELQLGYQDRLQVEDSTQNIWRVESVALLQPLAGLHDLRLNSIPSDLGALTQLTRFELVTCDAGWPLQLQPVAALTGLRHLCLDCEQWRQLEADNDMLKRELSEQLALLSSLTSLQLLRIVPAEGVKLRTLPPLPALRTLDVAEGRLDCRLLRGFPALEKLEAGRLFSSFDMPWSEEDSYQDSMEGVRDHYQRREALPQCLQLRSVRLDRECCWLDWVAPSLRHISCVNYLPCGSRLAGLHELRSLELHVPFESYESNSSDEWSDLLSAEEDEGFTDHLAYMQRTHGGQYTRLVFVGEALDMIRYELSACSQQLLRICRAIPALELRAGDARQPGIIETVLPQLKGQHNRVENLILNYGGNAVPTAEGLQLLAHWRCLQQLAIHAWEACDLAPLAADCLATGSPLTRIELHITGHDAVDWGLAWEVCAGVEHANPGITCTAHRAETA